MVLGLSFAHAVLVGAGLRESQDKSQSKIALIASGKILTGMSMYRTFALGADVCNAARSFLFSLGCIQALKCATNTCPTGITTQDPKLSWGLVSITTLFRHNLILSILLISLVPYLLNSNIYGMYGCNNLL